MSEHGVHVATLLGPTLLLAFWAGWSDLRAWLRTHDAVPTSVLVAALLSVGAGLLHAVAAPAHLAQAALYGAFFVGTAALQVLWAYAVATRPSRALLLAGALGQLAVVATWAMTRTYGVPLGPLAGRREPIGSYDLACTLLEVTAAACCVAALAARPHLRRTTALA